MSELPAVGDVWSLGFLAAGGASDLAVIVAVEPNFVDFHPLAWDGMDWREIDLLHRTHRLMWAWLVKDARIRRVCRRDELDPAHYR